MSAQILFIIKNINSISHLSLYASDICFTNIYTGKVYAAPLQVGWPKVPVCLVLALKVLHLGKPLSPLQTGTIGCSTRSSTSHQKQALTRSSWILYCQLGSECPSPHLSREHSRKLNLQYVQPRKRSAHSRTEGFLCKTFFFSFLWSKWA